MSHKNDKQHLPENVEANKKARYIGYFLAFVILGLASAPYLTPVS